MQTSPDPSPLRTRSRSCRGFVSASAAAFLLAALLASPLLAAAPTTTLPSRGGITNAPGARVGRPNAAAPGGVAGTRPSQPPQNAAPTPGKTGPAALPPAKGPAAVPGKTGPAPLPPMKGPGGVMPTNALSGTNVASRASAADTNSFVGGLKG